MKYQIIFLIFCVSLFSCQSGKEDSLTSIREVDICIYGGTSAGVVAAYSAKKMGKSVLLVEPGKYLGGMTTGGLGATNMQLPDWHAFSIVALESIIINSSNGPFRRVSQQQP